MTTAVPSLSALSSVVKNTGNSIVGGDASARSIAGTFIPATLPQSTMQTASAPATLVSSSSQEPAAKKSKMSL